MANNLLFYRNTDLTFSLCWQTFSENVTVEIDTRDTFNSQNKVTIAIAKEVGLDATLTISGNNFFGIPTYEHEFQSSRLIFNNTNYSGTNTFYFRVSEGNLTPQLLEFSLFDTYYVKFLNLLKTLMADDFVYQKEGKLKYEDLLTPIAQQLANIDNKVTLNYRNINYDNVSDDMLYDLIGTYYDFNQILSTIDYKYKLLSITDSFKEQGKYNSLVTLTQGFFGVSPQISYDFYKQSWFVWDQYGTNVGVTKPITWFSNTTGYDLDTGLTKIENVYINGLLQKVDLDYTVLGSIITFSEELGFTDEIAVEDASEVETPIATTWFPPFIGNVLDTGLDDIVNVYKNGLLQETDSDYILSGQVITFSEELGLEDEIAVETDASALALEWYSNITGDTINLSSIHVNRIFRNGLLQRKDVDYVVNQDLTVEFTSEFASNETVAVEYFVSSDTIPYYDLHYYLKDENYAEVIPNSILQNKKGLYCTISIYTENAQLEYVGGYVKLLNQLIPSSTIAFLKIYLGVPNDYKIIYKAVI